MSRATRKASRNRNRTVNRKSQKRPSTFRPGQPVSVVIGGEPDCSCPVCAHMAASGTPMMVRTPDGQLVERTFEPRPMIDVYVQGTMTTWPHFGPEPRAVSVPVGCLVSDLLEYLCFVDQAVRIAFPPGSLQATIDGKPCEPGQVVLRGETLVLTATPDPELSRALAAMLRPLPGDG